MLSVNTPQESISVRNHYYALQKVTQSSFERLSSGLRINRAKDDAAGLSISTRMDADIKGIQSSIQNATNWISLFQTAESGLNEITGMVQRIRELTVLANNATYTDSDRESMQAEVDQLVKEIDHISEGTVFNGLKVLNGDINGSVMQLGTDSGEIERVHIDKLNASNIGRGIIVGPNNRVNTNVVLSGMQIAKDGNVVTVRDTSASDDLLSTTRNANSALAKVAAINATSSPLGISAIARDSKLESVNTISQTTLDESNYLIINDEKISGFTVQDNDADGSLVDAINAVSEDTGVIASLNETNQLLLTADDGRNIELNVVGLANFAGIVGSTVAGGKIGIVSDEAFEIRNMAGAAGNGVAVGGGGAQNTIYFHEKEESAVSDYDITTSVKAYKTLFTIDFAFEQLNEQRIKLGALQNRLASTVNNLKQTQSNLSDAQSQIRDADFAAETAHLSRAQIIQQAGISMLAQSNQINSVALSLL